MKIPPFVSWRKPLLGFLVWFTLGVGLLSAAALASLVGHPFPGFNAYYHGQALHWYVDENPSWWPGVVNGEFQDAAKILSIEGVPGSTAVIDFFTLYRQAAQEKGYIELVTESWDKEILHRMPLIPFSWFHFFDLKGYDLIVGFGFWLLALAMYRAYRDDTVVILFILLCLALTIARWNAIGAHFYPHQTILRVLYFIYFTLSAALAAPLLIHLALLFPTRSRLYRPWLTQLLYGLYGLIAVAAIFARETIYRRNLVNSVTLTADKIAFEGIYFYNLAAIAFLSLRIFYEAFRSPIPRVRMMTRILLLGLIPTLFFVAPYFLYRLGIVRFNPVTSWIDLRYLYLALPLTTGLVILRYRAFRRANYLFLLVPVLAVSALAASFSTGVLRHLPPPYALPQSQASLTFFVIFLFIFLVTAFFAYQFSWQGFLGHFLAWDRYNLDGLQRFGRALTQKAAPEKMAEDIARTAVAELKLVFAAVWLAGEAEGQFVMGGSHGRLPELPRQFTLPDTEIQEKPQRIASLSSAPLLRLFTAVSPDSVLIPLRVRQRLLGLFLLGPRRDEELFDNRDMILLGLVGQQSAQFILASRQMAQLQAIPRIITAVQEKERFFLAQELHDTTQQLLGRLPFYLEASGNLMRRDPDEAQRLLQLCVEDISREAKNVRAIRNSLTAAQLTAGLMRPLRQLAERYARRYELDIQVNLYPELDADTTVEIRHALYRVVQQALDNIVEHARAGRVWIHFARSPDAISFQIDDDGIGIGNAPAAKENGGFGLNSMRARMEMLAGSLELSPRPEGGSSVRGQCPRP